MRSLIRSLLWVVVLSGIIVGIARATVIRWFTLPENDPTFETSVLPTLSGGDLVVAARLTTPKFGDLVVCPEPDFPSRYIIGRIVGEAGDTVRIEDGIPQVGRRKFLKERSCDPANFIYQNPNDDSEEISQQCQMEAVANHIHKIGSISGHKIRPEEVEFKVTEGKLFLLSDNRLYPYDSRNFGLVDEGSCKETIVARLISKKGWTDVKNRLNYIQ